MPKHPGGAPRKGFDWDLVDSLAILEADLKYVAERLIIKDGSEVNKRSLEAKMKLVNRRIHERFGISYVQYREQKFEPRRIKLRQLMWQSAEKGNVVMQIWLSKNILGYSDKQEISTPEDAPKLVLAYALPARGSEA